MTSDEIRKTAFETARKGYNVEDVDDFLQQVANQLDAAEADCGAARAERDQARAALAEYRSASEAKASEEVAAALAAKEDAEAKMYVLAEKVEEYRGMEDHLKNALINAQRMGETVVLEARQKADKMLHDATAQAELLTQKAEREIIKERDTLENILGEVNTFKTTILNLYKQHIEALSALDPPSTRVQEVLAETERYKNMDIPPENPAPALPDAYAAGYAADGEEEEDISIFRPGKEAGGKV